MTKTKVSRPDGVKYLGFSFYRNNKGIWRSKPHIKSTERLKTKLKEYSKRSWSVSMEYRIFKINPVIRGWVNYFRICDMKGTLRELDQWLRVRIRMCIWKQWKTPQRREWGLKELGMNPFRAHVNANSRKGIMAIASSGIMNSTVTNDILRLKGLIFLSDHYQTVHNY